MKKYTLAEKENVSVIIQFQDNDIAILAHGYYESFFQIIPRNAEASAILGSIHFLMNDIDYNMNRCANRFTKKGTLKRKNMLIDACNIVQAIQDAQKFIKDIFKENKASEEVNIVEFIYKYL